MPTNERPIEGLHAEVYAPIGGFIFGVSKFGDPFGISNAFVFGVSKFGDPLGDSESRQWVDYIADTTDISYNRGSISDGANNNAQVGIMNITLKNAGNPLDDYKIRAGRKVRVKYNDEHLFNGTLVKSAGRFVRKRNSYTKIFSIQVVDEVKRLAGLKAYGMGGLSEPYETFEERIERILDTYDGTALLPTGDAYPQYRLCATVYEGSIAAQLDLACNSVGASWYIDKLGQVRFVTTLTDYVTATFTDGSQTEIIDQPFAYWNLQIEYDNKNHINYLEIANKAIQDDPANPGNAIALETSDLFSDGASVKANGILATTLTTTLYDEGVYAGSIDARANEILTLFKDPQPAIQKIYFNMQENFLATQLETLHRVDLWLEGVKYNLRVTGISATINAQNHEWLIELDVIKEI